MENNNPMGQTPVTPPPPAPKKCSSKLPIILLTAIVTAIIVAGSIFLGQYMAVQQQDDSTPTEKVEKSSDKVKESTNTDKEIDDDSDEKEDKDTEKEDKDTEKDEDKDSDDDKEIATPDCGDWDPELMYYAEGQNLGICYNEDWGQPKTEKTSTVKGDLVSIRFADEVYGDDGLNIPQIWYESKDMIMHDSGSSPTCFDCVDFSKSEDEIMDDLKDNFHAVSELKKTIVGGKKAVRIVEDTSMYDDENTIYSVTYIIPNAFLNYHLQITIGQDYEDKIDQLVKTIVFK